MDEFYGTMSTNEIWRGDDTSRCLTDDLDAIEADIADLEQNKAAANHTHTEYASATHTHSEYASATHSHSYNDLSDKPTIPAAYTHPATHPASMITDLADVATSGAYSDLTGTPTIPTIPASLPANGGNADTVDNKHASDFALAGHTHDYAASNHTHDYAASNHTHSAATTSANGFMSSTDKSKLDGIATGANNYTHPSYTAKTSGLYKVTVDATGHVSAATPATKADITALGIPGSDTNTTYSAMTGATASAAGSSGLVPAPAAGKNGQYLRGDGTWATPTNTTYSAATTSAAGLMSAADKTKLDGIATGANNYTYTLPTAGQSTLGGVKTTSTVTSTSGLTACPIISGVPYYKDTNTTYSNASTSAAGLMSAADKTKLDGIATGATKTTIDSALSSTSTNPVQNKVINDALAGKAESDHTHSEYFSVDGGTINGATNVAGVLRVNGQQSFYFQTSTMAQTVGTNNATGGTTICCGSSADVTMNGANAKTPNIIPRGTATYTLGNTTYRWKGIYSTAAVNVSSDERLKRDIAPLDAEALADFINALPVVSYNYKDDEADAKARIGLIAQDVQRADAEISEFFVKEDDQGMLSIAPADLVFPLIAAVQQLAKRVKELESK